MNAFTALLIVSWIFAGCMAALLVSCFVFEVRLRRRINERLKRMGQFPAYQPPDEHRGGGV